jgi:RNA polymerase sigma-70 factor, ECF subfamily
MNPRPVDRGLTKTPERRRAVITVFPTAPHTSEPAKPAGPSRGRMTEVEAATVRSAIARDPEAFRLLVEQYHRIVLGVVYRLLAPRTPQDAEDHAQEIFVKLSRTIATFDFEKQTKFSTWFYTFVRNYCFDSMRKRRIRTISLSPRDDDDRPRLDPPAGGAGPADSSQSHEFRRLLRDAILGLPPAERMVFLMREVEGREYSDIAEELEIAEGTAKGRLYRAKEALRTKLAPYLRAGSLDGFQARL